MTNPPSPLTSISKRPSGVAIRARFGTGTPGWRYHKWNPLLVCVCQGVEPRNSAQQDVGFPAPRGGLQESCRPTQKGVKRPMLIGPESAVDGQVEIQCW